MHSVFFYYFVVVLFVLWCNKVHGSLTGNCSCNFIASNLNTVGGFAMVREGIVQIGQVCMDYNI